VGGWSPHPHVRESTAEVVQLTVRKRYILKAEAFQMRQLGGERERRVSEGPLFKVEMLEFLEGDQLLPLFGTCGGFQHVVLEYARHVLGFVDAGHAEYDASASRLFITPLSCSLVGTTMAVQLEPGSRAALAYGATEATERYYCNFGLNPTHEDDLIAGGLMVTGRDANGEARVVELPHHDFFIATLFVPQTSSTPEAPHPLIGAFIAAVQTRARRRTTAS
jgi:CTP synthase (UTP-ammonia lyase)